MMLGNRLKRARKAAGYSLRELAKQVNLSHAAIKKFEDGKMVPSSDKLMAFAKALSVRAEYFLRPEHIALECVQYRKHQNLSKKKLKSIEAEILDQIERRLELESLFPVCPVSNYESFQHHAIAKISTMDQVENIAEQVRCDWALGLNPIADLVDTFESNGIRVISSAIENEEQVDGLLASVNDVPIIVVNRYWTHERQRFTLAHELAHLCLENHIDDKLNEEKACNRFAAAFLLPKKYLINILGKRRSNIELQELILIKRRFGVSVTAILIRSYELEIISKLLFEEIMQRYQASSFSKRTIMNGSDVEKSTIFEQLLYHALAEDYIGEAKAAELLGIPLQQFREQQAKECSNAGAHLTW